MALQSCVCWSPCINIPANPAGELNELADQGPVRESNVGSNKASTKVLTLLKAPIPPLVLPFIKDLFTKLMKVFIETTQVQTLTEPQERSLKTRTPKTYWAKSYVEC